MSGTLRGSFFGLKEVTPLQGWTDVTCCVILLAAAIISNKLEDKKVEQIDVARQTAQDYVRPPHLRSLRGSCV